MEPLIRIARQTGVAYLTLAVTGMLGFLVVRGRLFVPDDAAATTARLVEHEGLARLGVCLELLIVLSQAITALWFFRLFRGVHPVAAGAIAAFGMANAVAILVSAGVLAAALQVAVEPYGDAPDSVQTLYLVSEGLWSGGAVFFGLWLIPMGLCALTSGRMPRLLGRVLIVGGVGYLVSPLVRVLLPDVGPAADLLTVPASVGEFWMVGYLLVRGLRPVPVVPAAPSPSLDPALTGSDGVRSR